VLSVAADSTGHRMVTTGADGQVKVWDLRTYQPLHSYFSPSPATWCDISQRGMLAVGWGRRINIWKDALTSKQQSPYMSHNLQGGQLRDFHFCPYEVRDIYRKKVTFPSASLVAEIFELVLARLRSGLFVYYVQKSFLQDQCHSLTGSPRHTTFCHLCCMLERCWCGYKQL